MRPVRSIFAVLLAVASWLPAQASLTTQFSVGAGSSPGSIVFFEITATNGASITGFDCNFANAPGTAVGLNAWIRGGTYVGNQLNSAGWSMVASASGTAAGPGAATSFTLSNAICVPAGTTLAFALESTGGGNHRFSSGTPSTYSNADLALTAGSVGTQPIFGGLLLDPRIFDGTVFYSLAPGCSTGPFPTDMVGVGEAVAGSGTLSVQTPQPFEDGWDLRWNLSDTSGTNAGKFCAAVINYGVGGSPPIGVSLPLIPGFNQVWGGSTPTGFADTVGPLTIGSLDEQVTVPAGVFAPGDVVRFQGITLEVNAPGVLPALPTANSIEFVHRAPPVIEVRCDGANSFNLDATFGFFSVENLAAGSIDSVRFDWVNSSNAAQSTMEFDTDQGGMADVFEGGNGTTATCLGTYRNNSAVTTGLVFDGANTIPATPCDPLALTGWTGTTPGNGVDDWRTLEFRFTNFLPGMTFEFDCDTDGGAGIGGDDMAGMVVTITLSNGTVFTGEVQATGTDLGQLFF